MKARWSVVLAVAAFAALLSLALANPAQAVCSGDDCGCYIEADQCRAECPPEGDPDRLACIRACTRESILCAKCCCCQCYLCAPQWGCGGGFAAAAVPPADDSLLFASKEVKTTNKCSTAAGQGLGFLDDGCAMAPAAAETGEPQPAAASATSEATD